MKVTKDPDNGRDTFSDSVGTYQVFAEIVDLYLKGLK